MPTRIDALEKRPFGPASPVQGKLRVLFGCGGDRDRTKRPRMARAVQKWADAIYVTSDQSAHRKPGGDPDGDHAGFDAQTVARVERVPDRREAIERIIADAAPGDVVLLAGKGHENYQIIGVEKRHFDDVEEAMRVLRGTFCRDCLASRLRDGEETVAEPQTWHGLPARVRSTD